MRAALLAAFLAASANLFAAQPFSHRLHTKLMKCLDCHAAAVTSTTAQQTLLPAATVCQKCHKGMSVPGHARSMVAHFDHAGHLKRSNLTATVGRAIDSGRYLMPAGAARGDLDPANECTACHRQLPEPDSPGRPALARMADCLVCHSNIDPPDSCQKCHAADAKLRPASHTPDFLDSHTTGKLQLDKTTCAVCHGRRFTCLGCH